MKSFFVSFARVLSLVLGLTLGATAQEVFEPPAPAVKAMLHFQTKKITVTLPPDSKCTLRTEVGTLNVPCAAIKSLVVRGSLESADVRGRNGERWLTSSAQSLVERILRYRSPLEVPFGEELDLTQLKGVTFSGGEAAALLGTGALEHRLEDRSGQVLAVNPITVSIHLNLPRGRQEIPMRRIQQLSVVQRIDVGDLFARVQWQNGFVMEGPLRETSLKVQDGFGNRFSVPIANVKTFSRGLASAEPPNATAAHRVQIRLTDGREQELLLPPRVIELRTSYGILHLSSDEILEWERLPNRRDVVVLLVDGSVLIGRSKAGRWSYLIPNGIGTDIPVKDSELARMVFTANQARTNVGGLYWQLKSSEVVHAELLAPSYRLLYQDGLTINEFEIPSKEIQSIVLTNQPSMTISTARRRYTLTPEVRRIDVVMPQVQHSFTLNWEDVQHVIRQPVGLPSLAVWRAGLGIEMQEGETVASREILVQGGTYDMGVDREVGMDDEGPIHPVNLKTFHIDAHEVTVGQFREFIERSGYRTTSAEQRLPENWETPGFPQEENYPVTWVSWHDAVEFCNWRSKRAGLELAYIWDKQARRYICDPATGGYRLPTEAEWEYAARSGGKKKLFPWGNQRELEFAVTQANFEQNRKEPYDNWFWTNPVDHFPASELGLYGMAGNVWEWCQDWYHPDAYYLVHRRMPNNPVVKNGDAPNLEKRVMRGGSYGNRLDFLRTSSRGSGLPGAIANRVGFRCVRSPVQTTP